LFETVFFSNLQARSSILVLAAFVIGHLNLF
jgi:hypothetical protein